MMKMEVNISRIGLETIKEVVWCVFRSLLLKCPRCSNTAICTVFLWYHKVAILDWWGVVWGLTVAMN